METIAINPFENHVSPASSEYEDVKWSDVHLRVQDAMGTCFLFDMVFYYTEFLSNPGKVDYAIRFLSMIRQVREELVARFDLFNQFLNMEEPCSRILQAILSIDYYVEWCDECATAVLLIDLD